MKLSTTRSLLCDKCSREREDIYRTPGERGARISRLCPAPVHSPWSFSLRPGVKDGRLSNPTTQALTSPSVSPMRDLRRHERRPAPFTPKKRREKRWQIDVTTKPKQDRIYPPLNVPEREKKVTGREQRDPKQAPDDALYREGQTDRVYTPNNPVSLSLTLRQKAVKLRDDPRIPPLEKPTFWAPKRPLGGPSSRKRPKRRTTDEEPAL